MATPTTTTTTRRTIALNLMLLQDCMHVSRSSQLFLPDPPPGPPVGPPFFLVGLFYQQTTNGRVFCPVQFLWISSSAIVADAKIRHFSPGRSTEPSFGSVEHGETVQQSFAPRRPLWETEKTHGTWHIPWSPWNTHLSELSWNKFWNSSRTSLLRLYMTSTYLYKLLRHRVKIDFLRATQAWRWSRDTAIMKRFWSVDKRMFWVCTFLLGTFP